MRDSKILGFTVSCGLLLACSLIQDASAQAESKLKGSWTTYYLDRVEEQESRIKGKATMRDGSTRVYALGQRAANAAESSGNVIAEGTDGELSVFSRDKQGLWKELEPGELGRGHEENPLIPYRTVAADNATYAFGTQIYLKDFDGWEQPDGTTHDGIFWVGDSREHLRGPNDFQIFVGTDAMDIELPNLNGRGVSTMETVIRYVPNQVPRYETRREDGVNAVLERLGYLRRIRKNSAFASKETREAAQEMSPETALVAFQEAHEMIPAVEYGHRMGAATHYYLSSAAYDIRTKGRYQSPASSSEEEEEKPKISRGAFPRN